MLLRTFGGITLESTKLTRPKPLLLLTYLALEGPQDRRYLAELFWAGARDHMKSLTVALTRLRKGAPGVIEADDKRVRATVETDAARLLAFLEMGELEEAVALYKGPFLDGFYLRDMGAELEEWVYKTREFLARQMQEAMLELAEREAAQARYIEAAGHAEAAYTLAGAQALEPEALGRLHTLLSAGNSPHAAEAREEARLFGIDLVGSAQEAQERLRRFSARSIPHNLPARGTAFVGRDLELTEVATLLSKPHCRLLTLVGPAGVGKTRLALQVAQEQLASASFQEGVYLVPLAPLATAKLIPITLAEVLSFGSHGSDASLQHVIKHIGDKNFLLVLDNFEHLMDGVAMVSELLKACPNLKLLVTSRERLNAEEEHIFPLAGLPFPDDESLTPKEAQHYDAVRLFVRRAKRANPDFELTEANAPGALRICRLTEGLPLGLELSAVWVRVMPPHEIASEIEKNLDILATPIRNVAEHHQSLRSAFEHSWKLLSLKEQAVLRELSVFRGGFRREAAREVTGATIPVLASLVDKSLLRVDPTGRYNRHRLLYHYTKEKLAESPEGQAKAGANHASYFLELAEALRPKLLRPQDPKDGSETGALRILATEHDNLRAALNWSLKRDTALTLRLAIALRTFWEVRGHLAEACSWFEAALANDAVSASAEATPIKDRFAAHTAYGRFLLLRGQKDRAEALLEKALELARVTGSPRDSAEALNHLGLLALERCDYGRAEQLCEQALMLHRSQDNKRGQAVTLNNLGNIARSHHKQAKALAFYQESLRLHRELGIRRSEAIVLANLGFLAQQQGKRARAAKLLAESLTIRHELGDKPGLAHSFLGLAALSCEMRDYEKAATLLGVTDNLLEATSVTLALADRSDYEKTTATARAQLSEEGFKKCFAYGGELSTDRAVADALELTGTMHTSNELLD